MDLALYLAGARRVALLSLRVIFMHPRNGDPIRHSPQWPGRVPPDEERSNDRRSSLLGRLLARRTALGSRLYQGAAFERLTQLYLQTAPEYRTQLRHVWLLGEVPESVSVHLNLPRQDEGIDIIAETRSGEFRAVQCKFRSATEQPLNRTELATFTSLAFAHCENVDLAVVAHTSAKPVGKRKYMGPTVEIGLDQWLHLDEEAWSLITARLQGRAERPSARLPRPHQVEAIAAASEHYIQRKAARGRLIMPCGTGKSLTAFWIGEALDARNILVAVPSLALIRQSLADWAREFLAQGEVPDWLCVCSDETVGSVDNDSFTAETYDLGIPTTTDQETIAAFLSEPVSGRRITFTTYQSSGRLAEAARQVGATFDLAVLDEAHRTVGSASKTFATLLRNEAVKIRRRLFMTATERVLRGDNNDVLSMDDEEVYGERFFQLSFKQAIEQSIIADYKIVTMMVSDTRVHEIIAQNRLIDLSPVMLRKRRPTLSPLGSHSSACSMNTRRSMPSHFIGASEPRTAFVSNRTGSTLLKGCWATDDQPSHLKQEVGR